MGQMGANFDAGSQSLICSEDWDILHLPVIQRFLKSIAWPEQGKVIIDGQSIQKLDSAGAWLIGSQVKSLENQGLTVELKAFDEEHQMLVDIVSSHLSEIADAPVTKKPSSLERVGRQTVSGLSEFTHYLSFLGLLTLEAKRVLLNPFKLRFSAYVAVIFRTGVQALPIIALLSFMIGIVITYQMGLQLKNYGANIFIVDLLGLSVLREFGPLITAIMVAGRTGSAFTAQLGMMKLNQEIDALDTLGVTPTALLLLPRLIGLMIALPLITMWADAFGVFGGMVMSNNMLSITWYDFLHRFPTVIPLRAFLTGLGKTPIFAIIIASIGCFQGMRVMGSADSVGQNTTRSVVLSIFFIIVADAIFSVLFSKFKL